MIMMMLSMVMMCISLSFTPRRLLFVVWGLAVGLMGWVWVDEMDLRTSAWTGDCLLTGNLSRYVTSHLGQHSACHFSGAG